MQDQTKGMIRMIWVSDPMTNAPVNFKNELQFLVYKALDELHIPYQRVETDEVITMEDCVAINEKLQMYMVKTLFLCTRHQQERYLFITVGDKRFDSKWFSNALDISRVSFAPEESMHMLLGTNIGAATVFSMLLTSAKDVHLVFDKDILQEEYYGCSDGTTTGYMKLRTLDITEKFLPATGHSFSVI